ncbi:MAG: type II toxin-antitoxin system VapC family toxin [Limnothrix sp.]
MIAVDTNILVRLLTQDDLDQYQKSMQLFRNEELIFIPDTVILETEWVLRFAYKFQANEICDAFQNLLGLSNVQLQDENRVAIAIELHREGLDFADALHLVQSQDCAAMYSFDRQFVQKAQSLTDYDVREP